MPIYVFRCTVCGREVEELQKFTDPPPTREDPCAGPPRDDDASREQELARLEWLKRLATCEFERVPTAVSYFGWDGSYNNDGRGGWVRQASGAMVRIQQGKNTTKYGDGSV